MNLINIFILLFLSFEVFSLSLEEEKKYDELEGVSFIKALVNDKKFESAIRYYPTVLKSVPQKGFLSYYVGEAFYQLKNYKEALSVLKNGEGFQKPEQYFALMAKASFQLKKYSECSAFFKKMPFEKILSSDWIYNFECLLKSGHKSEAVSLALNAYSQDEDFFLESQKVLTSFELTGLAKEKRFSYLKTCRTSDFYLRLWAIIQKSNTTDSDVLETGHACHPDATEITSVLIKSLFEEGKYHSIAYLFDVLSAQDKEYIKHAAEFYKVAGRYVASEYFFTLGNESDFILAKSSHFLSKENYAALLAIPFKDELQKNKDLSYALAFSYFKYFSLNKSVQILGDSSRMTGNQKQLLQLVQECQKLDWRCRP